MSNCNTIRRFDHVKRKIQMGKREIVLYNRRFDHVKQKIKLTKQTMVLNLNMMFDTVKPTQFFICNRGLNHVKISSRL